MFNNSKRKSEDLDRISENHDQRITNKQKFRNEQ